MEQARQAFYLENESSIHSISTKLLLNTIHSILYMNFYTQTMLKKGCKQYLQVIEFKEM